MANNVTFLVRGDTAANWEAKDSLLRLREIGYNQTNRRFKVGDGTTTWNNLPYVKPDVINDLITGGMDAALSAEQGKVLKGLVDGCAKDIETINQNITQIVADGLPKVVDELKESNSGADALSARQGWLLKQAIPVVSQDTSLPETSEGMKILNAQAFSAGVGNFLFHHTVWDSNIVSNLTTTFNGWVLSASQGPVIKGLIDNLQSQINNLSSSGGGSGSGVTPTLKIGSVSTGKAGSNAEASITGVAPNFDLNLTIPRGATGASGATPTINATVTKGAAGSNPSVTQTTSGTTTTFNFTIPQGEKGADAVVLNSWSNNVTAALSAAKGYELNEKIKNVSTLSTETWTFTLSTGSTVTKKVVLSS